MQSSNRAAMGAMAVLLVPLAGIGLGDGAVAGSPEPRQDALSSSPTTPGIEARADRVLRAMAAHLAEAEAFTFHADITYDYVVDESQMIQFGGTADIAVHRADRLRVEYRGDERRSSVVLDGSTATIHDLARNVYSVTATPPGLDAAVDHVFDTYGFSVPIADFVYSDPYEALAGFVDSGFYVGLHAVDGVSCHHLAFAQETIDWQIWIDAGPRPVPRKLVITYKDELGFPQYSARLSRWDLDARLSGHFFEFEPPAGADEIEFMAITPDLPPAAEGSDQ